MNKLILIFMINLFHLNVLAKDHENNNNVYLNDEDYYKSGVDFYDNGEFKKSFIVFFNLSEKGNPDAIYNISNMYDEGIGTVQNFSKSLEYTWLCALNGNKKCLKKIKSIKEKLDEDEYIKISKIIPETLESNFVNKNDKLAPFKLGYWYEKISPEIDLEKSYLWYSVSVSAGVYKAMKIRDRVANLIDKKKIIEIQQQAKEIYTKDTYFNVQKGE